MNGVDIHIRLATVAQDVRSSILDVVAVVIGKTMPVSNLRVLHLAVLWSLKVKVVAMTVGSASNQLVGNECAAKEKRVSRVSLEVDGALVATKPGL